MGPTSWKLKASTLIALAIVGSGLQVPLKDVSGVSIPEDKATASVDATALAEEGAYGEAVTILKGRLARPAIGNAERASILHSLGHLLLYAERTEEAIEITQAALDWALKQGLSAEANSFRKELAIQQKYIRALDLRSLGDIEGSSSYFDEAARLAGAIKSQHYQLEIVGAWSFSYLNSRRERRRYLDLSLQALTLAEALNYRVEASRTAKRIGTYYAIENSFSGALCYYLRALHYLEAGGSEGDLITCLNNIAGIYGALGDYVKGKEYMVKAASRISENSARIFEPSLLVNLGYLFADLGKRSQSKDHRQKALECFSSYLDQGRPQGGGSLRLEAFAGMAGVYINQGRLEEARRILIPALKEAREKRDSALTTGKILSYLGETSLQTGMIIEAERYFEETDSISRRTNNPLLAMSAAYGLGRCAEAHGDFGKAIDSYSIALKIVGEGFSGIDNDIHRADFIGKSREPFKALIRLYLKLSGTEGNPVYDREIFRLSEYLRARSYLELRDKLSMSPRSLEQPSAGLEEVKLSQERIRLLRMLAQGNLGGDERERLAVRIGQIDDLLDAAVFDRYGAENPPARPPIPVSLNLIQGQILDDRTAILEYLMGETGSMLFCICKDSFHLIELPPAHDLR
ncbi:MAG TPA: hypothetical protein DIW61_09845 [Candidatus Aminicenantes bacterium]|nr:hypothetical protein [Candidatus Aminicenantes bacterium]